MANIWSLKINLIFQKMSKNMAVVASHSNYVEINLIIK